MERASQSAKESSLEPSIDGAEVPVSEKPGKARITSPDELLNQLALFSGLSPELKVRLARAMTPREYAPGAVVVEKGDLDKTVFVISSGEAEVLEPGQTGTNAPQRPGKVMARLGPGDVVGEMALLLDVPRSHTVKATTALSLFAVDGAALLEAVGSDPAFGAMVHHEVLLRQISNALAAGSPFTTLDQSGLRWVAQKLRTVELPAKAMIVRKGDDGDALFIVRKGSVEVVDRDSAGDEIRLATLGPGEPFGERALLTGEPRAASVRALEPVELLRLDKTDVDQILSRYRDRRAYFTELMMMRERPKRIEHWVMEPQEHAGTRVYVLKDTDNIRYLKLSEAGAFVWGLLDGSHSIRDTMLSYSRQFHRYGVDIVLETVMQLHASGFVALVEPKVSEVKATSHSRVQAAARAILALPIHYFALPDVDRAITWAHKSGFWVLFTRPAQLIIAMLSAAGLIEFLLIRPQIHRPPGLMATTAAVLAALCLYAQGILHEFGHAITCKHFGREVHRAGVGWYYFLVVAFVDTSDIWLSPRRERMLVSAAGPYVNLFLGSLAMLLSTVVADPVWRLVLTELTVTGYALAIVNLNPLIETDGYYVLMDWLDIANFREKALGYLGALVRRSIGTGIAPQTRRLYLLYGLLALVYAVVLAGFVFLGYRTLIAGWVSGILAPPTAAAIGLGLAILAAALVLARVVVEVLTSARPRAML